MSYNREDIRTYLMEIGRTPLLSADEERDLAYIARGRSEVVSTASDCYIQTRGGVLRLPTQEEARDRLARSNLRLVVSIAKHYTGRGIDLIDLIGEGNTGILRALEDFEPSTGNRFSTYATWWIKQKIKLALVNTSKTIRLPVYMVDMIAEWRRAQKELILNGHDSTSAEIIERVNESRLSKYEKKKIKNPEEEIKPPELLGMEDVPIIMEGLKAAEANNHQVYLSSLERPDSLVMADEEDVDDRPVVGDQRECIEGLLSYLPKRSADIIRMRYGLNGYESMTHKSIGEAVNLSRERVRQIEVKSLKKLQSIAREFSGSKPPQLKDVSEELGYTLPEMAGMWGFKTIGTANGHLTKTGAKCIGFRNGVKVYERNLVDRYTDSFGVWKPEVRKLPDLDKRSAASKRRYRKMRATRAQRRFPKDNKPINGHDILSAHGPLTKGRYTKEQILEVTRTPTRMADWVLREFSAVEVGENLYESSAVDFLVEKSQKDIRSKTG